MSFQIGDKVRRKKEFIDSDFFASSGEVVTVTSIGGKIFFTVKEDNEEMFWNLKYFELVKPVKEPTQPKLRWLQVEYVKNTDHPMSGLNKHITAPVLQYWDGSDWQTVETVLEIRYEHL